MAHITETSGFTVDGSSECSNTMTTTGSRSRRHSTGSTQQDSDSYSTKQALASNDILNLLDATDYFHVTMFNIRQNTQYQLKVKESTTVTELAKMVQEEEAIQMRRLNLLQHNVVRIFCGYADDGKRDETLGNLGIKDGDRINIVVKTEVAYFPRSEWYRADDGSVMLGGDAQQRHRELERQRIQDRRDSGLS
ncbi:hypothetical protein M409DRAFT_61420 [Zasmidium cellare ATCC 36951]|uniref:Ubiquitin-like domain-containing protein n=1 Tax=Zasmidium cellare ATCC 36951 TaxID=1080233 RepID=A0A6A6BXP6_ZASCE|nr:uncharacterized protein M409DRAFT_61420 [Zasmidium cellare ATCC 36951]KAF2158700.1 hypothetical protein M409DRAFT_61420 [Zasmidium cellare ATCC 36951]